MEGVRAKRVRGMSSISFMANEKLELRGENAFAARFPQFKPLLFAADLVSQRVEKG